MRTLAAGLAALALAVMLSWLAGEHDAPSAPPLEAAAYTPLAGVETFPGSGAQDHPGNPSNPPAPRRLESFVVPASRTVDAYPTEVTASGAPIEARASAVRQDPASPIRHFTPGSRAHARAIASNLASPQFEDSVSPVARLYFASFGRFPDHGGLDHYVGERDLGRDLASIADEFAGSPEMEIRYGRLDNAGFVDRILENVGAIDPAQRAAWIARLDDGSATRGQLVIAFSENAAFAARMTNEVFVAMAYAEILRRTPDPDGFARWVAHLDAGHPRQSVIEGLLGPK